MPQQNSFMPEQLSFLIRTLLQPSHAVAEVNGSAAYPNIEGTVSFYQTPRGVLVATQIRGLPEENVPCADGIFGFHIHDGSECSGDSEDPFADANVHYNPDNCPHPEHAGDLPPLWGNRGYSFSVFLTNRFRVEEIIGKTVIIHRNPDDFTSQAAGNAGEKIACGEIRPYSQR